MIALPTSLDGPVAQLVEQGTENPCVGGSSPPWATILHRAAFVVLLGGVSACGADACETLCYRTSLRLAACLGSWSATWEDLGADSRAEFRSQCENDWAQTRADLEPREVNLAVEMLNEMQGCDELRALYLD
jgi:hypothetical protein